MAAKFKFLVPGLMLPAILLLSSFLPEGLSTGRPGRIDLPGTFPETIGTLHFPYRQAGLTERQAAAHLLSRFTYGPTPGEVDEVVQMGLEKWFSSQLEARLPDDPLDTMLQRFDALRLSNAEVTSIYPRPGQLIRLAVQEGMVDKDSLRTDKKQYRETLRKYMLEKGYKPQQELFRQFVSQKILRAAYSQNQLLEVMTDFWFNHFNVSITKNDCAEFIPAYERDVIRPGALGKFRELLLATAQSPAMLFYLDNFNSAAPDTGRQWRMVRRASAAAPRGLNENYAREVMELHTLGVDGGYTQKDVTEAARILTGWSVYPLNDRNRVILDRMGDERMERLGFVHKGDFLFNPGRHDNGEKTVLGRHFRSDGGYQEGVELLEMLAAHSSTAHFIARKIAVRFVSDEPPAALVDRMAATFRDRSGDIRQVLITLVNSPEFWSSQALREKIKSPFELAIGAVRMVDAAIDQPYPLYNWISRMGERKYYYQAPTGFPDRGQYWINTGSLLNRMNFGLALASGRIPGLRTDLKSLNGGHEPESAPAALATYCRILLPERDPEETIRRLSPLLNDPNLEVVGIIIGSPEYQRR